jgi:hypothetical protein
MSPSSNSPISFGTAKTRRRGLPTLFGRLSILLGSHERQTVTLENLRAMCNAIEAGQSLPAALQPHRLLAELGCELSAHFSAEEGPAHFGTMARMRPDLLPRVVDLKADHARLQRALARVELLATDKDRLTELPPLVSALLAELGDHERAEGELMEEFFRSAGPSPYVARAPDGETDDRDG